MDSISTSTLLIVLVILIVLSAFFSSSETGLMSLNRYKLRHLAQTKHKAARRVEKLLARPDRLLGLILIGNNHCFSIFHHAFQYDQSLWRIRGFNLTFNTC